SGGGCRAPNRLLADAVQYARDRGVLVVAPAGDSDQPCVADPAAAPEALAVGGYQLPARTRLRVGRGRTAANWGAEITVAAPALDLASTIPLQPGRTPPDDRYATSYGTAFAAGLVGGAAALLLSQNPLLTPDWLTQLLALGARPLADGSTPGWAGAGAIDIAASLRLVPAGFAGAVTIEGEPAPDGTLIEAYVNGALCASTASFTENGRASYALLVPAAAMQAGCGSAGVAVELRVNGAAAAQTVWNAAANALDLDGAAAATSTP
ncbi:MAG TPA: S8 family serine peptidase, partial [Dehalococcoidia bacterium]|nr:S8 family serine peptidase [Dehalococcoidia bacterium]